MNNYKSEPLTNFEREFATKNHNLVYSFLHRYGYSLEIYYDVVIFGYLKAVRIYNRMENVRNKYDFSFVSWQYMRVEIENHFKKENAKKRKPVGMVVSLDAEYAATEALYNRICIAGQSPESEIMALEELTELLNSLSITQKSIVEMKINGYSSKEIYSLLEIKQSTYYVEVQRIKKALKEILED